MIKLHTTAKYIIKNNKKMFKEDRQYSKEELNGVKCLGSTMLLIDLDTKKKTVIPRGKEIEFDIKDEFDDLTKAELVALMPDKDFPKSITKKKLLEEWRQENGTT